MKEVAKDDKGYVILQSKRKHRTGRHYKAAGSRKK